MGKKIDLTGQRFGRLVVVEGELISNKKTKVKCICDCGNDIYTRKDSLKKGTTKSCGCLQKEIVGGRIGKANKGKDNSKNMTGVRSGRLVAVKKLRTKENGHVIWLCICECGNYKELSQNKLQKKHTKSCGCLEKEGSRELTKTSSISKKRTVNKNNKSGKTGVCWASGKWQAEIYVSGVAYRLGRFHNKQDAINARKEAEDKYFKPILDKYGKS